ncbi:dihydropyrimidinase [Rhizobium sp. BK529]|uniref:dihydropyrimidinase n=1 Tax=Rhizobium sp. BK529 TaxID=2586983 RepID=UPI0017B8701C|nr:dihydropyrimidinase [Rhizobium sp. BK529]MBB3594920.1 dihydropyrimidinase [Rhizobium sp. BK529]
MIDLIVVNGTIATNAGTFKADIGIDNGRIVQIGGTPPAARRTLSAAGLLVLPGGVDVHTHLDAPSLDMMTADDFRSGTIAAACGGTTSLIDFCQQTPGGTLADGIANWNGKAEGKAAIDYGYHMLIPDFSDSIAAELETLPEKGITSFKLFMSGKGGAMVDDQALVTAMEMAKRCGAMVMVHAENGDAIDHLQRKYLREGKTAPKYHAESRPARAEAEATARAIALAEMTGAPLYVVHVTCAEALEEVVRGKLRGAPVLAETCTHYLFLTKDSLDQPGFEGAKYVFSPPARTAKDKNALWLALRHNILETVSSDHSSTRFHDQKQGGRDDFTKIPNGLPGIEERFVMLYQGVVEGRITIEQFVDLACSRPARTFGLAPRKGTIAVGSDADIVLFDADAERIVRNRDLHHAVDYSAYEGMKVRGRVVSVLLRGEVIVDNGEFCGEPGYGRFLPRARVEA